MAESSKLPSPNKKKIKHSKLTRAASTKTTFKYEWKKEFPFITSIPYDIMNMKLFYRCNETLL